MRWMVTLELPNENQSHSHIDVGEPEQAAKVIRAVRESTGLPIDYSIEAYESEWRCERCPAWRFELHSRLVTQLDDRALPMRVGDLLPVDQRVLPG